MTVSVLLRAPLRADEKILKEALQAQGVRLLSSDVFPPTPNELASAIVVCTQEGLTHEFLNWILTVKSSSTNWDVLPIVLILDRRLGTEILKREMSSLMSDALVTILRRPLRMSDFAAAVSAATEARTRQQFIMQQFEFQDELKNELNHRLKNTLSTVTALYRMSLKQSVDLKDFDARFSARLGALNAVQELLRSVSDKGRTLMALAQAVLAPYYHSVNKNRIDLKNLDVMLSRSAAFSIALALNELATNAAKYGALSCAEGSVRLSGLVKNEMYEVTWGEQGGPEVTTPKRISYGTKFIEGTASALGGQVSFDYAASGLVCRLRFNLIALRTD